MLELTYGKSMYGGWYAQDDFGLNTWKANTLKELKKQVAADNERGCNFVLKFRFDNI